MIFQRSSDVPIFEDYTQYREYLRRDFRYRCAYCLTHERYFLDGDAGEIDHFRPLKPPAKTGQDFSALKNVYSNLYWTCSVCNNIKSNKWSTEAEYFQGFRFLDPCEEDHDAHWQTLPEGKVVPLTSTGEYTVRNLRLNRRTLCLYRERMLVYQQKAHQIIQTLETKEVTEEQQLLLEDHLQDIKEIIEPYA